MTPTKQTYRVILRTPQDVARTHAIIDNAQVSTDTPYEVTIKPYELTRSQAQNRLYRKWLAIICEETGQDTDSLHLLFKERFLVPLLCAADDTFADRVQAVKQLRRDGAHEMADFAKGIILDYASTTSLKVRGMTTYLDNVSVFAAELGITLSQPE
jgi:hypothetical protein